MKNKFRWIEVDSELFRTVPGKEHLIITVVVQKKVWWGWKTIVTYEGSSDMIRERADRVVNLLNIGMA